MVSKLMNVRVHYEVFIARWKRLATCFVDYLLKGDNNNGIAYDSTFYVDLVLAKAV